MVCEGGGVVDARASGVDVATDVGVEVPLARKPR